MDKIDFAVGQILKVDTGNETHYEVVIETGGEIITKTLEEHEDQDGSTQGITSNWNYEVVPNHEIVQALRFKKRVVLTDKHCICPYDQYGGSTHPDCLIHGKN